MLRPCTSLLLLLGVWSFAQPPTVPAQPFRNAQTVIRTDTVVVVAPTIVRSKNKQFVHGVQLQDFELYDNNALQKITTDISDEPISLVVAVERSSYVQKVLPRIQRVASMLHDLVVGQTGAVALIAFDHTVTMLQDFTGESPRISRALKSIAPGSSNHVLLDAVADAAQILEGRPQNDRRVVLLITERRDKGSTRQLQEALASAQASNAIIYALDISALVALGSEKARQPPPVLPTTAYHIPAGGALTPTTIDQNYYMGNYVPAFIDLFQGVKNVFVDDMLDVLTRFTGGKQYSFVSNTDLENVIQKISEELHSQYLLSYVPSNQDERGFHEIRVVVNRPNLETHTRLGYWLPPKEKE